MSIFKRNPKPKRNHYPWQLASERNSITGERRWIVSRNGNLEGRPIPQRHVFENEQAANAFYADKVGWVAEAIERVEH